MTVAAAAAVTDADVQEAIGAEGDVAAVVIVFRIIDVEQHDLGGRDRARCRRCELRNCGHAVHEPEAGSRARVEEDTRADRSG